MADSGRTVFGGTGGGLNGVTPFDQDAPLQGGADIAVFFDGLTGNDAFQAPTLQGAYLGDDGDNALASPYSGPDYTVSAFGLLKPTANGYYAIHYYADVSGTGNVTIKVGWNGYVITLGATAPDGLIGGYTILPIPAQQGCSFVFKGPATATLGGGGIYVTKVQAV